MSPSEEIIDFYRQAVKKKKGIVEEVVKESSSVNLSTPTSSEDPLENFLFKLTDILKTNKPVVSETNTEQYTPTIIEEVKTAITETVEENENKEQEPLERFLHKLTNILQTKPETIEETKEFKPLFDDEPKKKEFKPLFDDEPKDKTPNIKNAAIELINNLKQVETPKEEPKIIKRTDKALPQKKKDLDNKTSYVEELKNADKDSKPSTISPKDPLREKIEKIVKEMASKQRMGIVSEGGGGDGNFSTEYKYGGSILGDLTVQGNLNVNGVYLSAGNPFTGGGGGGGSTDRLVAGTESLILSADGTLSFPSDTIRIGDGKTLSIESENTSLSSFTKVALSPLAFYAYDSNDNSITFDTTDNEIVLTTLGTNSWTFSNNGNLSGPNNVLAINGNLSTSNKILSGGVDLANIFLTQETDSQTLSFTESSAELFITNGNSISLSSLNDKPYIHLNFLPLSGGIITNNLTIQGNISALGTATFANTIFTTTSAVSVVNTGPGPALYVYQAAGPYDVASFYDGDGIEVLHVGNAGSGGFGKVGVNESFPNKELTVRGSISATETIYDNVGNSVQWNAAYNIGTAYQSTSSSFATNTTLNSVSSLLTPLTLTNTLTGELVTNSTFNNYQTNVANTTATLLPTSIYQSASGNWQNTYTTVQSNSAANWKNSKNIWVPAAAWIPRTTAGCGVDSRELSASNYDELLFDAGTTEFAQALITLPDNWNYGTITSRFFWTATGAITGSVVWGMQGVALSNNTSLSASFGTPQTTTNTISAQNFMHVTLTTPAITLAGSPGANTPIQFQIYRDALVAGDTLAVDARLLGVEITYTTT